MDLKDWTGVVVAIVAVYGAVVSTYNLVFARRQRTRQVTVTLATGLLALGAEPASMLLLTAANPGDRTVTLTRCHLQFPNRKKLVMVRAQGTATLPHELHEGKNCTFWFPVSEVARALIAEGLRGEVTLVGVVTDALDRSYCSDALKTNVDKWAKAEGLAV